MAVFHHKGAKRKTVEEQSAEIINLLKFIREDLKITAKDAKDAKDAKGAKRSMKTSSYLFYNILNNIT
jgi:hypothetical protein